MTVIFTYFFHWLSHHITIHCRDYKLSIPKLKTYVTLRPQGKHSHEALVQGDQNTLPKLTR